VVLQRTRRARPGGGREDRIPTVTRMVLIWPILGIALLFSLSFLVLSCSGSTASSTSSAGGSTSATSAASNTTAAPTTTSTGHADVTEDLFSPAQEVLNAVYSSVVNIAVQVTVNGRTGGGVGSGVVYTADGLILTNDHVVTLDGQVTTGQQITVTFSDGSTAPATIVGTDAQRDVAAIQVQKTGLHPVTFGASKDVQLAQWAIVIGSPLDFRNTVSLGIVSGLDRTLDTGTGAPLTGLMQVDTPISPGNSGGGCFDTQGRFIGMPEVYLPPAQTGAENIGFCIPADTVAAAAKALTGM
jgi:S1-C subfamily serine protease